MTLEQKWGNIYKNESPWGALSFSKMKKVTSLSIWSYLKVFSLNILSQLVPKGVAVLWRKA